MSTFLFSEHMPKDSPGDAVSGLRIIKVAGEVRLNLQLADWSNEKNKTKRLPTTHILETRSFKKKGAKKTSNISLPLFLPGFQN